MNGYNPDYQGKLLGIDNNTVYGWAYDANNPESKLILEVLLDGYPAAITIANLSCKEYLTQPFGDNCYGFVSQIPYSSLQISHRITIRVANTEHLMPGNINLVGYADKVAKGKQKVQALIDSQLIYGGGMRIMGHYFNPIYSECPPNLNVYDNDRFLYSKTLTLDKNNVYKVEIELPAEIADGKKHLIKVTDEEKRELKGSPVSVLVYPNGPKTLIDSVKQSSSSNPNQGNLKLLENIVEQYNRYLPASLSFENYPYWFDLYSKFGQTGENGDKSIVVLIYGLGDFNRSINSLLKQSFKKWHALVVTEQNIASETKNITFINQEDFNLSFYLKENKFDYACTLRAGDRLAAHALTRLKEVFTNKNIRIIYTDIDYDDKQGNRSNPWFKPDWDYELFLSQDYVDELFAIRCENIPFNYSNQIELLAKYCIKDILLSGKPSKDEIFHIQEVLYHKQYQKKEALNHRVIEHSNRLIQDIVDNSSVSKVVPHSIYPFLRKIEWHTDSSPLVSIIIPTRDQAKLVKTCIKSLIKNTAYKNYEILIVDNQSTEKKTKKLFDKLSLNKNIKILKFNRAFNYSAINNYAVKQANGEVIALVNNDIEFQDDNWLDEMLGLLLRDNVGAVGCKLVWPNGMVQHGGVVLGVNGLAAHSFNTISENDPGYFYRAQVTQQYSAVTAACLLTRKKDYLSVGGLDEIKFPVAFNDVDFCLKLRAKNKRIVWTPFVKIIHAESVSRGKDDSPEKMARAQKEMNNLKTKWGYELMHDPFYNPNLNLDHLSGPFNGLAIPPRTHFD